MPVCVAERLKVTSRGRCFERTSASMVMYQAPPVKCRESRSDEYKTNHTFIHFQSHTNTRTCTHPTHTTNVACAYPGQTLTLLYCATVTHLIKSYTLQIGLHRQRKTTEEKCLYLFFHVFKMCLSKFQGHVIICTVLEYTLVKHASTLLQGFYKDR